MQVDAKKYSTNFARTVTALTAATALFNHGRDWYSAYKDKTSYTVTVSEGSELHLGLLRNLEFEKTPRSQKAFARRGEKEYTTYVAPNIDSSTTCIINGEKITIRSHRDEVTDSRGRTTSVSIESTFEMSARNKKGYQAIISHINKTVDELNKNHESHFYVKHWDGWVPKEGIPARSLESVVLGDGQKERLIKDIGQFLSQREKYSELGIPYHRGYLLYGPPGTGKSSTVKAIANHFNVNIYYLSLSEVQGDEELFSLMSNVKPDSIILLEDIDTVAVSKGEVDDDKLTTGGLMNALDGLCAPEGVMYFMTTNNIDKIQPSILRSGRIDVKELIGETTPQQFKEIVQYFTGETYTGPCPKTTPDKIIEIVKQNFDTPHLTLKSIERFANDHS